VHSSEALLSCLYNAAYICRRKTPGETAEFAWPENDGPRRIASLQNNVACLSLWPFALQHDLRAQYSIPIRQKWFRFDSIHARKSIRIDSSDSIRLHMAVTKEVGGGAWLGAVYGACSLAKYGCPTAVSAAVIRRSVVWQTDANNQYNRIGRSDFWGKPNRFESQIGIV